MRLRIGLTVVITMLIVAFYWLSIELSPLLDPGVRMCLFAYYGGEVLP